MDLLAPKIKPELLRELAKLAQKPEDLFGPFGLFQEIKKSLVEQLLEVEMEDHLGYAKGDKVEEGRRPNSRNGYSEKTVKTESGPMTVNVPRDRDGSFAPKIIPKNLRRLAGFDEKVLALYARGMTTLEILKSRVICRRSTVQRCLRSSSAKSRIRFWNGRRRGRVVPSSRCTRLCTLTRFS